MSNSIAEKRYYWKIIVAILTAGWIVIWLYRTALTPIYPTISEFFGGISDSQLGNISSYYFLGYVLMQIPSGLLVDRLGKKKVLIPGFLLFAIGALVVATSTTLTVLFIGSVIAGVGCGTFYGVAYSLTNEYVPESKKSFATAIVNSGTAIGSGAGLVSSSYFVKSGIMSWQMLLLIIVFLALIMIALFLKLAPNTLKTYKIKNDNNKELEGKNETVSVSTFFKPQMIAAYVIYFSTLYGYYLVDTWLPNFLETERGFQGTAIGIASSLFFFTAIPGALLFSRITDVFPKMKVSIIIILEIIAAFMLFFMATTESQNLVIAGIMAYGFFGKLGVEPIIISWLATFAPKKSVAATYGLFNFFGMLASVVAPTLTGFVSDNLGSKVYAFYLAIIINLVGTLLFYVINKVYAKENRSQRVY